MSVRSPRRKSDVATVFLLVSDDRDACQQESGHNGPLARRADRLANTALDPRRLGYGTSWAWSLDSSRAIDYHGFDSLVSSQVMNSTSAGRPAPRPASGSTTARARRNAGTMSAGCETRSATTPSDSAIRV